MASIKSKIKSAASKVKSAATSYAKNVAGGAGIVASAVSSAVKKVGNQSATVLNATNAKLPSATTVEQPSYRDVNTGKVYTTAGLKAAGLTSSSPSIDKGQDYVPAGFNPITGGGNIGSSIKAPGNLLNSPVSRQVATGGFKSSGFSSSNNISSDGMALQSNLSGNSLSRSFSPAAGTSINSTLQGSPAGSVVNNLDLTPTNAITLPDPKVNDYSLDIPAPAVDPYAALKEKEQATQDDYLKGILGDFQDRETGAEIENKLRKQLQIEQKQQLVSDLTGQLNGIVAKGQANQLALVGQGRGIPEVIIGGQQAQIGRETAIAALPVQAQLSAAQGNLEMANDSLDRLFKIYSEDAQNEFEYKREVRKAIYDFATASQKRDLEKLDKAEERKYQSTQDLIKTKQSIAMEAAKNGASAATLTKIANATDFASAISSAGSSLVNTSVVKLDNGNTVIVDSQGKVIKNLGGASSSGGSNFVVTQDILKNNYGGDLVSVIANTIKSSGAKQNQSTNDAINVIAGLQGFVRNNPDGKFEGLSPIRLPNKLESEEGRTNRSDIEAINLKVQQWASGASLTEAQTKSVEKMTPRSGDTDGQVRDKVNSLANYMVSQVSGQLAGQGVGFAIDRVDMFTKTPEQELLEIYKDPVMQQKIKQATVLFPDYTDAEILQIVTP